MSRFNNEYFLQLFVQFVNLPIFAEVENFALAECETMRSLEYVEFVLDKSCVEFSSTATYNASNFENMYALTGHT